MTDNFVPILNPSCTLCPLHTGVHSVCVPSSHLPTSLPLAPDTPRILMILQNPGPIEDRRNENCVGPAGRYVRQVMCDASLSGRPPLSSLASIHLLNTARCHTPSESPPTDKNYRLCSSAYLYPELDMLTAPCGVQPILFCLGRAASSWTWKYLTGKKGKASVASYTRHNGSYHPEHNCFFVGTYHPAAMIRERSYHESIMNHLGIVLDILQNRRPTVSKPSYVTPFLPE